MLTRFSILDERGVVMPSMSQPMCQSQAPSEILLRFGTFLLACTLCAMHWGRSLPQEIADLCHLFGLCGFAFYFALEFVADHRAKLDRRRLRQAGIRTVLADRQFARRMRAEQAMIDLIARERGSLD